MSDPYGDNILRCLSCADFESRLAAELRLIHTGRCAARGGGELVLASRYWEIRRANKKAERQALRGTRGTL